MTNLPFSPTLFIFAAILLGGCTDSGSPTGKGDGKETASTEAAVRTGGTRVDSLNGIPSHRFGEPLSAFPGIEKARGKGQDPGTQTYVYPDSKPEPGWFGKHKADPAGGLFVFYVFKEEKFVAFQAIAFGASRQALQKEAVFLFGPGRKYPTGTSWDGKKAEAFYTSQVLPKGPAELLDVKSLSFVRDQASEQADRLKKENAQ